MIFYIINCICIFCIISIINIDYTLCQTENSISIDSDSLQINQNNNSAHFTGGVLVFFEDTILRTADLIIFYDDVNRSIKRITIPSKLVLYKSQGDILSANKGEFIASERKLILTGNVILKYDGHIMHSNEFIVYTNYKYLEHIK